MEYVDINGISVAYTEPYSASYKLPGGVAFANLYCDVVSEKVNTLYELCSGPGFIGFTLLSKGLCDKVIFSDSYGNRLNASIGNCLSLNIKNI